MSIDVFYFNYIIISFFSVNCLLFLNEMQEERVRFPVTLLIVIFLSVFFGARGVNVGVDTINYIDFFRLDGDAYEIREPLFRIFKTIDSIFLFENFSLGLMLVSISINLLFLFTFRQSSKNYPGIFALFIASFLYVNININIIRQGLAMSIMAFGVMLSFEKKKGSFGLYVISALTHYSSVIVMLVVLAFQRWKNEIYKKLAFFVLILIFFYFFELKYILAPFVEYSSAIYNAYWILTWNVGREWNFKHIYYLISILVLFSIFVERGKLLDENSKKRKDIVLLLCAGFFSAMIFKSDEMFVDRMFYYFIFLVPIVIYNTKDAISKNHITFPILFVGTNVWLMKTLFLQFPGWFIPPYDSLP